MDDCSTLAAPVHVILISTANAASCLDAARSVLERSPATLHSLNLKPVGGRFEAVLRIVGASDGVARRVADMLAAWPELGSVSLEHQLVRR